MRRGQGGQEGGGDILTCSFDLFLSGFVPQVREAEDGVMILVLTKTRR